MSFCTRAIPGFVCHLPVAFSAQNLWAELLALLQEKELDVEGTSGEESAQVT